jgi:hypothetical protein
MAKHHTTDASSDESDTRNEAAPHATDSSKLHPSENNLASHRQGQEIKSE